MYTSLPVNWQSSESEGQSKRVQIHSHTCMWVRVHANDRNVGWEIRGGSQTYLGAMFDTALLSVPIENQNFKDFSKLIHSSSKQMEVRE